MIKKTYEEGRIIRGTWSRTDTEGRQLLCLYTALLDDPYARPASCPADVCPLWLAHLLPWIDDAGSEDRWPDVVRRIVAIAPRFSELSDHVEYAVRGICVREAMRHTDSERVLGAVVDLCDRAAAGGVVSSYEWLVAGSAVQAAAEEVEWAAWSATETAVAVSWAAWSATETTMTWAEALAARARTAAADRMIDKIINALESDLGVSQ